DPPHQRLHDANIVPENLGQRDPKGSSSVRSCKRPVSHNYVTMNGLHRTSSSYPVTSSGMENHFPFWERIIRRIGFPWEGIQPRARQPLDAVSSTRSGPNRDARAGRSAAVGFGESGLIASWRCGSTSSVVIAGGLPWDGSST